MRKQVGADRPTVYADMNVFRYVALGELSVDNADEFLWVYSSVHLDEVVRGQNTDALDGMRTLRAVEFLDVLNERFESIGNIVLLPYVDPHERFQAHLGAIAGYEHSGDSMVEHLLRFFGADNFSKLALTPQELRNEVERLTSDLDPATREDFLKRANDVSITMEEVINTHLKDRHSIDETRRAMGLTSSARDEAQRSSSPIDAIWKIIEPSFGGSVTKNQFFGFEPHPAINGVPHTQHGALAGAHTVLNLLGISPDGGLAKREKIETILSDGQHAGFASYCNALLSADTRFCNKARAIYKHAGCRTNVLWFPYKSEGCSIRLGFEQQ